MKVQIVELCRQVTQAPDAPSAYTARRDLSSELGFQGVPTDSELLGALVREVAKGLPLPDNEAGRLLRSQLARLRELIVEGETLIDDRRASLGGEAVKR